MTPTLPPPLARYLRGYTARKNLLHRARTFARIIVFALLGLLALCLADRFLALSVPTRLMFLAALPVALLLSLLPIANRKSQIANTSTQASAEIEHLTPLFSQRLQTVVSQLSAPPALRGSPAMLDNLLAQVADLAARHDPRRLLPWRLVARPWAVAAAAAIVWTALWPVDYLQLPSVLRRCIRPLAHDTPVTWTRIDLAPVAADVPEGDSLSIEASATHLGNASLTLFVCDDGRTWNPSAMSEISDNHFALTLRSVDRDLSYYLAGGDAVTPVYQVRVKRPPGVAEFRIDYTYPPYMRRAPLSVANADGLIEAPAGTEVVLTLKATEPLDSASLNTGGRKIPMTSAGDPTLWTAALSVRHDQSCEVEMLSRRGVEGRGPGSMTVRALSDAPPVARLFLAADDLRAGPRQTITVYYEAADDYGIAAAALQPLVNGIPASPVPLSDLPPPGNAQDRLELDLSAFKLEPGDLLALSLRVDDVAGQHTTSPPRYVLITPAPSDEEASLRLAALQQALEAAAAACDPLDRARRPLEGHAAQRAASSVTSAALVSSAADSMLLLRRSLLAAVQHSDAPALTRALGRLVDDATIAAGSMQQLRRSASSDGDLDAAARADLTAPLAAARRLVASLRAVVDAQRSVNLLAARADLHALKAMRSAATAHKPWPAIDRLAADVDRAAGDLRINGSDDAIAAALGARIAAGRAAMDRLTAPDFPAAAVQWSADIVRGRGAGDLEQRLAAAAEVRALRPDPDFTAAADLRLAARAAGTLGGGGGLAPDPLAAVKLYPADLASLLRDRSAAARLRMSQWAGPEPSLEELILTACAQAAAGDDPAAVQTDRRIAAEVRASSASPPAALQEIAAAMNAAASAAAVADPSLRDQQLRRAAVARLALFPGLRLTGESLELVRRTGARTAPLLTASRRPPDPPGYADALRAYFQALDNGE